MDYVQKAPSGLKQDHEYQFYFADPEDDKIRIDVDPPVKPIASYKLVHTWNRNADGSRKAERCTFGCSVCN